MKLEYVGYSFRILRHYPCKLYLVFSYSLISIEEEVLYTNITVEVFPLPYQLEPEYNTNNKTKRRKRRSVPVRYRLETKTKNRTKRKVPVH